MKDATGELNMTVIVIVGIAALAAFFTAFILPNLKVSIAKNQCEAECGENWEAPTDFAKTVKNAKEDSVVDCDCSKNVKKKAAGA